MLMEFDRVTYTYPCTQQPALHELTLRMPQPGRYAVIGRNGCGKTTLFRLANGLYQPTRGTVRWQGEPLRYDRASLGRLRQQVGLVFQDPEQQLVAGTVEEDLSYGLCNLRLPDREVMRRVQQALIDFQLTDLADTPVNTLSLGQKKRLSIADVVVLQPQLLLLDEPTAYLDTAQTRNLLTLLDRIHAMGITTVIATHDLDFVDAWADWIFVMDQGRLVMEGAPTDVFKQRTRLEDLGLGVPLLSHVMDTLAALPSDREANPQALSDQIRQSLRQRYWAPQKRIG